MDFIRSGSTVLGVVASLWSCAFIAMSPARAAADAAGSKPPNLVIIFADDLGYGDLGCYGAADIPTPHLDRLAAEGMRFTDFQSAAPVCTPSRAALLTGCYPLRVGLPQVLFPRSDTGLGERETTLAGMLKPLGYATACVGKWHLGSLAEFHPTRHGFDEYFGIPYSNDMGLGTGPERSHPRLPLLDGLRVAALEPDQTQLTTLYAERAVRFIETVRDRPFFLYLAHSMPHVPLSVSGKFKGKSGRGLYGDVIMEIDWSVGRVLEALDRRGVAENTLVMFTSDNGPWLLFGDHGGRAGPLREGKGTTFEGGQRVPCIMRWPRGIPAGRVCGDLATTLDIVPTFAALSGARLPDHPIDGHDIRPLLEGRQDAELARRPFFHYCVRELQAVRRGSWKLHLRHRYQAVVEPGREGRPGRSESAEIGPALFDLSRDPGERNDLAGAHRDIVSELEALAGEFDARLKREARPAPVIPADEIEKRSHPWPWQWPATGS